MRRPSQGGTQESESSGQLDPQPLHDRVEIDDVDVARAALVREADDAVDERCSLRRRLDSHDLVRLDVGAEADDELGVAVEQLLVHSIRRYSVAGVEQADLELDQAILERLGLRDEFWQLA
jgi:hypothetical protein